MKEWERNKGQYSEVPPSSKRLHSELTADKITFPGTAGSNTPDFLCVLLVPQIKRGSMV